MRYKLHKYETYRVEDIIVASCIVCAGEEEAENAGIVIHLATEFEGKFYELFTDIELEKIKESEDETFDLREGTPYVFEVVPLSNFLAPEDEDEKTINAYDLLRIVSTLNALMVKEFE